MDNVWGERLQVVKHIGGGQGLNRRGGEEPCWMFPDKQPWLLSDLCSLCVQAHVIDGTCVCVLCVLVPCFSSLGAWRRNDMVAVWVTVFRPQLNLAELYSDCELVWCLEEEAANKQEDQSCNWSSFIFIFNVRSVLFTGKYPCDWTGETVSKAVIAININIYTGSHKFFKCIILYDFKIS